MEEHSLSIDQHQSLSYWSIGYIKKDLLGEMGSMEEVKLQHSSDVKQVLKCSACVHPF